MVPFWIFDGPFKIERRLPMLPLSRESARLDDLKQSLALYRLTFGQPAATAKACEQRPFALELRRCG
jgi:hypothetical protein